MANELGLHLRTSRGRRSRIAADSYGAGKAAGDRAQFGRPVSGDNKVFRLPKN